MSRMRTLGLVLLVLGAAAFVAPPFTYSRREEVLRVGPIEATAQIPETLVVPDWLAGVLVGMGVALVAVGSSKKT